MKKFVSILLCAALLLSMGAVTAFAEEQTTREIYVAASSSWHSEGNPLTLYVGTGSYISPSNSSTYSASYVLSPEQGGDAVLAKVTIPSDMTKMYLTGGGHALRGDLTEANVYFVSGSNLKALSVKPMEGVTFIDYETEAITVPEGTTAILVGNGNYYGVPYGSVNNGTVLYAYTRNSFTNNGTILDGEFSYLKNYGTIENGTFTYNIHNYGTIEGGSFYDPYSADGKLVIYNYEGGKVSDEVRAAAHVVEAQPVTMNLTNLTHDAESLTTTVGEAYSFTLTPAEGYAVPESITVTIGGEKVTYYDYTPAKDSRSAEVYIGNSAPTGPIVITAAGEKATFAPIDNLTLGETWVVKNGVVRTTSGDNWSYDVSTNTLTLSGVTITTGMEAPSWSVQYCGLYCSGDLTVKLEGENVIDLSDYTDDKWAVYVAGDLTVTGSSTADSLTVTGGKAPGRDCRAIDVNGTLAVDRCTLNATAGDAYGGFGICCEALTVTGNAQVSGTAGNNDYYCYGVDVENTITIDSGTLTGISGTANGNYSIGISCYDLIQTGGTVTGTAGQGYYGSYGLNSEYGSVSVTGGTLTATAGTATSETGHSVGLYASSLTVGTGGTVTATAGTGSVSQDIYYYWNGVVPVSVTNNGTVILSTDTAEEALTNNWFGFGYGFVENDKIIFMNRAYVPGGAYADYDGDDLTENTYFTHGDGYIFLTPGGSMGVTADLTLSDSLTIREDFAVAPGVTVTVPEGETLDLSGAYVVIVEGTVTGGSISKATPVVTAPVPWEYLEYYWGDEMTLVKAGSTTAGTLQYSLDGENWSAEVPTATDAGTYTVYYRVEGNDFVYDVEADSVTVIVNPYSVSVSSLEIRGLEESYQYYGEAVTPEVTLFSWGTLIPASEYVVTYENNEALGTATMKITDAEGGNLIIPEMSTTFQIVHTEHRFTNKASDQLVSEATCTEPAVYKVKCDGCEEISPDMTVPVGEANGHSYTTKVSDKQAAKATCEKPATYYVVCDNCDVVHETMTVPVGNANGHAWGDWTETKAPQVGVEGQERRDCENCDAYETRKVDALEDTKPTDPTSPSDPEDTKPTDPTTPSEPEDTKPTDPTTPSEPEDTKPTDPEKPVNPFTDVKEGKYYYDAVLWAVNKGITTGKTETTFEPDEACTRKQIVTFLWRAAGEPEPESMVNPFTDVKADRFEKAILWAYYKGITTGTTATTFSPEDPCTRKQIVTFLWRFNGEPEAQTTVNPFTDVKADRFQTAILWAYENGITTGKTATTFEPEATCTRCQIVTFLYRASVEE